MVGKSEKRRDITEEEIRIVGEKGEKEREIGERAEWKEGKG